MEGVIAKEPAGTGGFGYDPILYLPEFWKKSSAELTMEEKKQDQPQRKGIRGHEERAEAGDCGDRWENGVR